ncbi:MAG: helix-turn-helix domain-containing protein [Heliomarina sp.]|uniref:helix-turn-helix domain-containing protein n=1 Tax=Heliomarina sp. TaxID=2917556 RepID=UPI00405A00D3
MAEKTEVEDFQAFGKLVRQRRQTLGLSQEALASDALGNPDRKSFVSAIENNRLKTITPSTAQKLSGALGLSVEDVPASLRWPLSDSPSPIEARLRALEAQQAAQAPAINDKAIARFLNRHMAAVLDRSMSDIFRDRLIAGLEVLRVWTGAPFSLQSLMTCYALSMLYLVAAGLLSFFQGDITIGSIRPFYSKFWIGTGVSPFLPYASVTLLLLAMVFCIRLVRPLSERQTAAHLAGVALIAGISCGLADYIGTQTMIAAALFSVPCVAAISTLRPRRAAFYGAAGGVAFGLMAAISSGLTDDGFIGFLRSLSEGFIIGGLVGGSAGLLSSLIAGSMPHLRAGQLAASGGGIGFGALISLAGIVIANQFSAITDGMIGLFALSWLALPLANAALDYLSLGVSHSIGLHVAQSGARLPGIALFMLLDLVLAIIFMVLTVVLIGLALQALDRGLGVDMQSANFLTQSAADPWGRGLWLTTMALTTVLWTLLHFGFVVAPLAAGALTRVTVERFAVKRLEQSNSDDRFDATINTLVTMRFLVFYGTWVALAASPVLLLAAVPQIMRPILSLGAVLALRLM